jgi:hypothetical protein
MDYITEVLNKWAKNHTDIERAFFFMSGYINRMEPAYVLIVTTVNGTFCGISDLLDMLKQPIKIELKVFADDKLVESAIPGHAIKITPPNSGRLRTT